MRTIGRFWPTERTNGDYQCMCDICGVHWRRSQLRRDGAGRLVCPDELPGRDEVTLDRQNAAAAARKHTVRKMDSGNYDREKGTGAVTQRTTGDDIEL
jgi:hypothetical protein